MKFFCFDQIGLTFCSLLLVNVFSQEAGISADESVKGEVGNPADLEGAQVLLAALILKGLILKGKYNKGYANGVRDSHHQYPYQTYGHGHQGYGHGK